MYVQMLFHRWFYRHVPSAERRQNTLNPTDVTQKITHSYFIEDGSFVRCQDLTIGYTLPELLTSKMGISKARFYVSASNLFIITGHSGYDLK